MMFLRRYRPAKAAAMRHMHPTTRAQTRCLLLMLASGMLASGLLAGSAVMYAGTQDGQTRERVIVVFETEMDWSILDAYGASFIRELKIINAIVCTIDPARIEPLKGVAGIKDVIPDAPIAIIPPEPRVPIGIAPGDLRAQAYTGTVTVRWNNLEEGMNAKAAWDRYDLDGSGVKIAFIDTAVNYTLPDLRPGYLGGKDIVNNDDDPLTTDPNLDHGTEVTSVAIGRGVSKVVGAAYNAGYYVVNQSYESGQYEGHGTASTLISAIEWAASRADIISMSLGFDPHGAGSEKWAPLMEQACDAAYREGVVLVAGSGNDARSESVFPAGFDNVISVGGHGSNQAMYSVSNGGVDIVAPGVRVYVIDPVNKAWWDNGTSLAVPHASALIALQMQYARQRHMEVNNGYHWLVMTHGAVDLGVDPIWQGKGKIWAAATDSRRGHKGSIDLMAGSWPLTPVFQFSNYAYMEEDMPVYYVGSRMRQSITLANVTDRLGNTVERIEDLRTKVRHTQADDPCGLNASPSGVTTLPVIYVLESGAAHAASLSDSYAIPPTRPPGLYKTVLGFEFHFAGDTRAIKMAFNEPQSLWYATVPGDLNLDARIDLKDFAIFAGFWRRHEQDENDAGRRADVNLDGLVDWRDLQAWAGSRTLPTGLFEGFESGTFTTSHWGFAGDGTWQITSSERHSGQFSAQAVDVQDGQNAVLAITVDCDAGDVGFWRKVSSESGWDVLEFAIDGVRQDAWSGDLDWDYASFPVRPGERTFTWTYSKDDSSAGGLDSAWIDDIVFPTYGSQR